MQYRPKIRFFILVDRKKIYLPIDDDKIEYRSDIKRRYANSMLGDRFFFYSTREDKTHDIRINDIQAEPRHQNFLPGLGIGLCIGALLPDLMLGMVAVLTCAGTVQIFHEWDDRKARFFNESRV